MSLWTPDNIMDVPPYPPDRFDGEPEHSASLRFATEPEDYSVGPMKFDYLVTETKSDGDYGLYRVELGPRAGGAAAHYHRAISEAFYVLDGTMRLFDGDKWVEATTGDFLYVPPGGVHGFRNDADEPAQVLVLFSPGAPRESYFEGLSHLSKLTDDERREWNFRHDSYFL
ncbi:mannose-6-phosphate isomerase-like protein (cupin superfamily) [Mycolicibacterium iranicum]|uniref:Mannose-6-phosphate isomerase-like protein (Cupin superfamily) n=1 Tax=Mycolicibacterium iranicum TaxID=912594 RepID=A0A839Q3X3_MYCIR|nr:cupin domain-containing protein [Mycolicibacterium iranicum]MBB2989075.1 mannose-6-phosphate isomerase-like protein (cupin superfamily) [Mycolicibacterium iranicum]